MSNFRTFSAVIVLALLAALPLKAQELSRRQFRSDIPNVNRVVKVALFDADSTLRVSLSGSVSANTPTDVMILPGVPEGIARLVQEGYFVAIVSNQAGVTDPHVKLPITTADAALEYAANLIEKADPRARIHYIDFAEANDEFRKRKTGMAHRLEDTLKGLGFAIDWGASIMVGDSAYKKGDKRPDGLEPKHFSNSDRLFAENLRAEGRLVTFREPNEIFGWQIPSNVSFEKADQVREYLQRIELRKSCGALFIR